MSVPFSIVPMSRSNRWFRHRPDRRAYQLRKISAERRVRPCNSIRLHLRFDMFPEGITKVVLVHRLDRLLRRNLILL